MSLLRHVRKFEDAVIENGRFRLILTLFVVPPLFLLSIRWIGEAVIIWWLLMLAGYAAILIVAAVSVVANESRKLSVLKTLLAVMTPLIWGFMLAVAYYFLYLLIFDPENLSPK